MEQHLFLFPMYLTRNQKDPYFSVYMHGQITYFFIIIVEVCMVFGLYKIDVIGEMTSRFLDVKVRFKILQEYLASRYAQKKP